MKKDAGFSLLEVLVAMMLLAVIGLAVAYNTVRSYSLMKRGLRHSYATQLALDKLEELEAISPINLTSANNSTESAVSINNVFFTRTVSITVNADSSRTVIVTVMPNEVGVGGITSYTSNMPLWANS